MASGYAWWLDPKIMGKSIQQTPYKGGSGYTGAGADGIVQPMNRVGAIGNGTAVDEGEFVLNAQDTQTVGKDLVSRIAQLAKTGGFTPQVANTVRTAVGLPAENRMVTGTPYTTQDMNAQIEQNLQGFPTSAFNVNNNSNFAMAPIPTAQNLQSTNTGKINTNTFGVGALGNLNPNVNTTTQDTGNITATNLPTAAPLAKTPSFDEMNRQRALGNIRDIMTGQSQPYRTAANVGQQNIAQQGAAGQEALQQSLAQKGIEGGAALAAGMGQQRETGMRQAEFAGQTASTAQQQMASAAGTLATESLAGMQLKDQRDQYAINALIQAGNFDEAAKAFTKATGMTMDAGRMEKAYNDKNLETQMDKALAGKDYAGYAAAYEQRFGTPIDLTNITSADQLDRIGKATIALTDSVASGGKVGDATTDAVLNNLWQASGKTGTYDPKWGQGQIDAAIKAADPVYQQLNSINEDTWRQVFNDVDKGPGGTNFVDNYKGGWDQLKSDIYMTTITGGVTVDANGQLSLKTDNAFAQKILGATGAGTVPQIDVSGVTENIDTKTMTTSSGLPVKNTGTDTAPVYELIDYNTWSKDKNITDPANANMLLTFANSGDDKALNDAANAVMNGKLDINVKGMENGGVIFNKLLSKVPSISYWTPTNSTSNLGGFFNSPISGLYKTSDGQLIKVTREPGLENGWNHVQVSVVGTNEKYRIGHEPNSKKYGVNKI